MMNRTGQDAAVAREKGLGPFLFIAVGLAIIIGGLWTLYMGDAPYHPIVPAADGS